MEQNKHRIYQWRRKDSWEDDLFLHIEELMKKKQVYLDSKLKRKQVALMLKTNECYLVTAIRKGTKGMTFMGYLNSYRLSHAYKRIKDRRCSIEKIVSESGFTSRTTFYRLFKQQYGVIPTSLFEDEVVSSAT